MRDRSVARMSGAVTECEKPKCTYLGGVVNGGWASAYILLPNGPERAGQNLVTECVARETDDLNYKYV